RMRALAVAILLLGINVLGLAIGPLAIGVLNDVFAGRFGVQGIRYSLLVVSLAGPWAALHSLLAARALRADLAAARSRAERARGPPSTWSSRRRVAAAARRAASGGGNAESASAQTSGPCGSSRRPGPRSASTPARSSSPSPGRRRPCAVSCQASLA